MRQYTTITRPFLAVKPWEKRKPPLPQENLNLSDLLVIKVEYFQLQNEISIPDEWLALVISELRKHLEYAFHLENEIENVEIHHIKSILNPENLQYNQKNFYNFVLAFYWLFTKLAEVDSSAASKELSVWISKDDYLFIRLSICAARISGLISDQAFFARLENLSDELFWDYWHRNDLLHVLAQRWNGLTETMKQTLEQRLLAGIKPSDNETIEDFNKRNASVILNRLHWLQNNGCIFTFDLAAQTQRLRVHAPEWNPDWANNAADSWGSRIWTGRRAPDESCSELLTEILANILSKAEELASIKSDSRVDKEPYSGFCKDRPNRSFSALTSAAKQDNFPRWAWEAFFNSEARQNDKPKFSALIAERVARYLSENLTELLYLFTSWLKKSGETLAINYPASYYKLIETLIQTIAYMPSTNLEIIKADRLGDWVFEAINSPIANLGIILMASPTLDQLGETDDFPEQWLQPVEKLLALPGMWRCFALTIFSQYLEWFYSINQQWTEAHLLVALSSSNNNDKLAFWRGFLRSKIPHQNLYLKLKPEMLDLAKHSELEPDFQRILMTMILAGWGSKRGNSNERWVTDDELHDVILRGSDTSRQQLIWHIKHWSNEDEAWLSQLPVLFSKVWPQRLSAKTPETTKALFNFVFSDTKIFKHVADHILPLMSQTTSSLLNIHDDIFQHAPETVLALLHKAFAENDTAYLPYGLDESLNRIVEINPKLRADSRWLTLKRKL